MPSRMLAPGGGGDAGETPIPLSEVSIVKAAVVHSFDQPLAIEDVPMPEPGPEQVLVHIETCGLCHTDIHAARGDWPVKPSPPFIPGHEGVGIIERVGPGNTHGLGVGIGSRSPGWATRAGTAAFCNSGRETLCERQLNTGYGIERRLRRVRRRLRAARRARPRRDRARRRGSADVRGGHDVQGRKGLGRGVRGPRRGVRGGWPGPPGRAVRRDHGRPGRRGRRQPGAARRCPTARRGARHPRRRAGPGGRDQGARRRPGRDQHRRQP